MQPSPFFGVFITPKYKYSTHMISAKKESTTKIYLEKHIWMTTLPMLWKQLWETTHES